MGKPWSTLAKVVYKRTYSRKIVVPGQEGFVERLETYPETVERAVAGNVRGFNVPHAEIERLRYFMLNRKAGPSGRGYWFSGTRAHEQLGGVALNNCFRGSEKLITKEYGPVEFQEVADSEVTVWTKEGWKRGCVSCFGDQFLQRVVFAPATSDGRTIRSNHRVAVTVTPNHGWFLKDGTKTTTLKVGDVVPAEAALHVGDGEFEEGVRHGLIFGDGTLVNTRQNGSRRYQIRLCGGRAQAHVARFQDVSYPESYGGDPVGRCDSDEDLKDFPRGKGAAYRAGFLHGWMDADGNWSKSTPRLSSQHPGARAWLEENAAAAGYVLTGWSVNSPVTNYGVRKNPLYTFVLADHDDRMWKVQSIEPLPEREPVYCATVPGVGAFTLASGIYTSNCWFLTLDKWTSFVTAQDLLMLGGGVGGSVEHKYVSKLPRVRKGVVVRCKDTKDADFIVPDSREGWCELTRRVLEAFFVTGRSFTYSTVCVRGYGEPIKGFGGTASGPIPLKEFVEKLCAILATREGRHLRPIDAADILCAVGEMVVAGNVRRSAIIVIGDGWDKDFLKAKRWDLGPIPTQRDKANWSVVCEDVDDLHPLYWKTYEAGEAFGLVNLKNIQKYGRMGELRRDAAKGVNPCGEATLEDHEPCNLQDVDLPNLDSEEEFVEAAVLMQRWGIRVACARYHIPEVAEVVGRNHRVGTSITGCLQSPLFNPATLDRVYKAVREEAERYAKELGIEPPIRNTTLKPSGTKSKMDDVDGEGIHCGFSRYMIQRVRFAANDPLLPVLKEAGHYMEPVLKLDGTYDHGTMVVDFYRHTPDDLPCADEGFDTWKQLEALKMAQKHWSDQAVSVTVYYKREEIERIKEWLSQNLKDLKTISFLCHSEHGYRQAPKEAVTREQYERAVVKLKPLDLDGVGEGGDLDGMECVGGACPIR